MCAKYDVPHIVNNAYGVQASKCMHLIQQVCAESSTHARTLKHSLKREAFESCRYEPAGGGRGALL